MRGGTGRTAMVAGLVVGWMSVAAPLAAQEVTPAAPAKTDSAPHFALFVGEGPSDRPGTGRELGASGDFRWGPLPVPLRLTLALGERSDPYTSRLLRTGRATLELVMRPIPKTLGIRPYFLGGLGMATRAGFGGNLGWPENQGRVIDGRFYPSSLPQHSWAFGSLGLGLDVGRVFVETRAMTPVASDGFGGLALGAGFRFWD